MKPSFDEGFWEFLDRPKGSQHPRYQDLIYPLDYGYLEGTTTADGGGLDVWIGSKEPPILEDFICTVDLNKQDIEIKLLLGCTREEITEIYSFLNQHSMRVMLISRKINDKED